jgi:hypothetical protein
MVDSLGYIYGVLFAVASGISNNIGTVLNKKVVNEIPNKEERFIRQLIRSPVWLLGILLQLAVGSVLFIIAVAFIGSALVPGLMAIGLIFLAIGAVRIVHERLNRSEWLGIVLMIGAITMLGFSGLSVSITLDYTTTPLLTRILVFTGVGFIAALICFSARKGNKNRAILYAIGSGLLIAQSNYWISPLEGVIGNIFIGTALPLETFVFIAACAILVLCNMFSLSTLQIAFQTGQASNLVPIQQVPIQIAPIFYYFYIYYEIAPDLPLFNYLLMILAIGFIIVASFLLGRRQAQLENIK